MRTLDSFSSLLFSSLPCSAIGRTTRSSVETTNQQGPCTHLNRNCCTPSLRLVDLSMLPTEHARHGLRSCSCLLAAPGGNLDLTFGRVDAKTANQDLWMEQSGEVHACRLSLAGGRGGFRVGLYLDSDNCQCSWSTTCIYFYAP